MNNGTLRLFTEQEQADAIRCYGIMGQYLPEAAAEALARVLEIAASNSGRESLLYKENNPFEIIRAANLLQILEGAVQNAPESHREHLLAVRSLASRIAEETERVYVHDAMQPSMNMKGEGAFGRYQVNPGQEPQPRADLITSLM